MNWNLFNLFSKDYSKEEQKITPDQAKRLLAQFKELSPDILQLSKVKEKITFDEAINYFQSDHPGNSAVKKGAIIRIEHSEWQILGQVFLDQNNQIVCHKDGTSYGRQLAVRKLDKKLLESFDGNNDIFIFEMSKDEQVVHKPEVVKVSDDVQLTVKGLPYLPKKKRKAVLESLIRNTLSRLPQRGYNKGENIYQGQAKLNFNNELYEVFFSLDAIRVITALEIYKEAFDAINTGAIEGVYDSELAKLAANNIQQSAWNEVRSVRDLNRGDSQEN